MEVIKIGTRFRVVDEPGAENSPGRFTFEQQTTDAAGRKKWDVCQSERGGMLTLPYLLVVELVRGLHRERRVQEQALIEEEREEKPVPAIERPMTLRRVSRHGVL